MLPVSTDFHEVIRNKERGLFLVWGPAPNPPGFLRHESYRPMRSKRARSPSCTPVLIVSMSSPRYFSARLRPRRAGLRFTRCAHLTNRPIQLRSSSSQTQHFFYSRRRRFVITTDSNHGWQVYPNLARHAVVTQLNQLWVADITYVRLQQEFIYLAVVVDVYSRRVVGWNISRRLDSRVAQQALESALIQRQPAPGLIHHSDRGLQYACREYVQRLEENGITISMSRPGNPYDNAWAESFMKTLKVEEVDGQQYRDFQHAESSIGTFIEEVYNRQRLHSALDYLSPVEFETEIAAKMRNRISTKKEKRSKKERKQRKGRPVETATAVEIHRWPSAPFS
jgi:putative transposase